jgi:hypothetical protein
MRVFAYDDFDQNKCPMAQNIGCGDLSLMNQI